MANRGSRSVKRAASTAAWLARGLVICVLAPGCDDASGDKSDKSGDGKKGDKAEAGDKSDKPADASAKASEKSAGGEREADDSSFGTGLSCFTFPGGEVTAPADWPYAIPSGLVLGSFDNLNPGSSNVAGATGQPTEVLAELQTIFADYDPKVTADNDNNRVIDFNGGSIKGQIQAFSGDGGFDTPTCVRLKISYVDKP